MSTEDEFKAELQRIIDLDESDEDAANNSELAAVCLRRADDGEMEYKWAYVLYRDLQDNW